MLFCLANGFKPATIDDLAYVWYVRQIAQTPAQPFGTPPDGFHLNWYQNGQPAYTLLMPMVVPYWLASGYAIFGENLFLLKVWLFPFCLLFTASLYALFRRFAPGMEKALLALTAFSPTFLPSLNLMVDVPAVALNLTAIAIFCRALDGEKPGWRLVILAGLVAGLAAQTKYTGATAIAAMLLYGLVRRQRLAAIVAIGMAAAVFVGWEAYLSHVYGRSHFLSQLELRRNKTPVDESAGMLARFGNELAATFEKKAGMTAPLFGFLGGLGFPLIPLFLIGLRCRLRLIHCIAGLLAAGFLAMALLPERWATFYRDAENSRNIVSVGTIYVGITGVCFVMLLGTSCTMLVWKRRQQETSLRPEWFLIGWLLIELLAYFALTPFGAARRVMGTIVVATIILGRLLTPSEDSQRIRWVYRYCVLSILIGLIYAWTDYRDAVDEREALVQSVKLVREQSGENPRIWFTGHWGFQYYGEQQGLKTIYPYESIIEEGDWLIIPESPPRPYAQTIALDAAYVERRGTIEIHDCWPLNTNSIYYDGYMPIRRHDGYRLRIAVFRANQRFHAWPD